jgi:glycosyltransferase involved in cell wall biosynthesis
MKLLFIAPRMHTNQLGIIQALQKHGHEVTFHSLLKWASEDYSYLEPVLINGCFLSNFLEQRVLSGGVNHPYRFPNPFFYFSILKKLKPDVIIAREPNRLFSLVGALCGRILGAKIIFYSQIQPDRNVRLYKRLILTILFWTLKASWVTPLKSLDNNTNKRLLPKYLTHLPFVVGIKNQDRRIIKDNEIKILMVAKPQTRKNHLLLINALKITKIENIKLTFVSECVNTEQSNQLEIIQEHVAKSGLQDKIVMKINLPHNEVIRQIDEHDIFILPATREQASISNLEAMGRGLPTICSDTNGTSCFIKHQVNGMIFEDNNLESLAHCISEICCDRVKLQRMSSEALITAKAEFGDTHYMEVLKNLLKKS